MKKFLFILLLVPSLAFAKPCCDAGELRTIADLNYLARVALGHQGSISTRLYQMNQSVTSGNWQGIPDSDVGELLGYMAATPDGTYWRSLINSFANAIGVVVKSVTIPIPVTPPPPILVPPTQPPPAIVDTATKIDAAVRAVLRSEIAGLQAQVIGLAQRLSAEEAKVGGGGSAVFPGITASDPNGGELTMRSNIFNNPVQSGITDSFCAMQGVNGWDGGFRILQNWNHCGTKRLPYGTIGMDSQGDFSYNWFPAESPIYPHPDAAPASVHGNPSHPFYAPYRGQALVISGSQVGYGYLTGQPLWQTRNVMIAAQRAGQSLYFAVSPTRTSVGTASNRVIMKLEADPNYTPNPVHVVIDGELRRLKSCNVNGITVVCF